MKRLLLQHRRLWWAIGGGTLVAGLTFLFLAGQRAAIMALGEPIPVAVAAADMGAGVLLEARHGRLARVPRQFAPPGSVHDPQRLVGLVTRAPVAKGEIFTATRVAPPSDQMIGTATIPRGYRIINIPLHHTHGVAKLLRPHDRIDLLAEFAFGRGETAQQMVMTVLHDIKVVAAEAQHASLLVTPEEAQQVVFALSHGEVLVSLRPADPEESSASALRPTTAASVTGLPALLPRREYRGR